MGRRESIELGFESFGRFVHAHAWLVIVVSLLVAAGFASGVRHLVIDVSTEAFLREDDPVRIRYAEFRAQFGREDAILVALEPPEVFDAEFLETLRAIHREIERDVPHVHEVTSLINARDTRGEGDLLIVEDLLARPPADEAELEALRARVAENPLYRNNLISDDGRTISLIVELETYAGDDAGEAWTFTQNERPRKLGDYRGPASLRAFARLELALDLPRDWKAHVSASAFRDYAYAIQGRTHFPSATLDLHEREVDLEEAWLEGELFRRLDLKLGRQIVSWGRSDNLRVVDVLNPVDRREPGRVDLVDLRLPVMMTRLDYHRGPFTLTAIAIHESRFDDAPDLGSEFFPCCSGLPDDRGPANGGDDTEWAAALTGVFSGFDFSLHWARVFDDAAHLEGAPGFLRREHSRISLYGVSGNRAIGNWLLKAELAWLDGLELANAPGRERARLDAMAGVEYAGLHDATITLELVNRWLPRFSDRLEVFPDAQRRNRLEAALRASRSLWNDRLQLQGVLIVFGDAEEGSVGRLSAHYDLSDALDLTLGMVLYQAGDRPPLSAFGHADRLFLEARYHF